MSEQEELTTSNSLQEEAGLELGDTIQILGGRLDKTKGVLYYFDEDQFKVLPMGVSDRLITIPLVDGSPEEELGIEELIILQKVVVPGFITLADIRVGQGVDTFQANGIPGPRFTVTSVNMEEDSAVFTMDSGDIQELTFDFSGIPRDMPFEVIRTKDRPAAPPSAEVEETEFYESEGQEAAEPVIAPPPTVQLLESIELDELDVLEETPSSERIYPDVIQMTDMLSQLLLQLTPEQQKNPLRLKELGRLVEVMLRMRNEVVRYGVTGEPRGGLPTSLQTLAELIQQPSVPLSRKVIEMTKELYLDHSNSHYIDVAQGKGSPDPMGTVEEHLEWKYLEDVVKQAAAMDLAMQTAESASTLPTSAVGLPTFFVELERMRAAIQSPYHISTAEGDATRAVGHDEEVFRLEAPSETAPSVPALNARGRSKKDPLYPPPPVEELPQTVVRLLGPRSVRFQNKEGESLRTVEAAEVYTPETSLLFPRSTLRALGPIRSRMLAQDMSLASTTPLLLNSLLAALGDSSEFPTAEGILRIGLHGGMVGNIRVKDWLESLSLPILGTADAAHLLHPYGLDSVEFSMDQSEVLHQRILLSLAALRKFLIEQRQTAKQFLETLRFTPSGLLEASRAQRLLERIQSEPLLRDAYDTVKKEMGELADIDLVWIPYLNRLYPDLLLAVLGQQPLRTAKERAAVVRDQFAQSFQHGYALRHKLEHAGVQPEVNSCPHVGDLETIRKVRDDADRMRLLTKFLGDYRGMRENNWIECNVCSQHLLCAHELFQIQMYLRPAEKDVLEKELNLTFSGGVFHGKFICKNCGQAMRDLDFDTHIEFDDEGRPMMGRSVMVDEDALRKEALEDMLSGPADTEDARDWGSEDANMIYRLLFTLTNKIGISPDERDYERMIEQISGYVATLYTRSVYAQITKAQGKAALDYDVYRIRFLLAGTAAHLLLNIQTHVPEYIIRYTHDECKAGFFGFPLESEANTSGIECMSGVLAGFMKDEAPWNQTGFQKEGNIVKRKALFRRYVESLVKDFAKHPLTQNALRDKRGYLTKLYGGTGGDLQDQIPTSFRPVPLLLSAEEAAELAVAPAAAKEEDAVGTAWIRQAHAIARANTVLNPDIPYAETTCCFHDLRNPQEFWDANSPFTLAAKRSSIKPKSSVFGLSSKVVKQSVVKGDVDPRMLYQLFSHVCFQGPRKGAPHELGLTLRCRWCGVQFPEDPSLPPAAQPFSSDRATQAKLNEEYFGELLQKEDGIKASLQAQGAVIDEESFQDVLDTSRQTYRIAPLVHTSIQRPLELVAEFAELDPAPFPGWEGLVRTAFANLEKVEGVATALQIAQASEELLERLASYEEELGRRVGESAIQLLQTIASSSSSDLRELLTTHMIIPFSRWTTGFIPSNSILRMYELSKDTEADIQRGMESHVRSLTKLGALEPNTLPHAKVVFFVAQLSAVCSRVLPKLRAILLPGGKTMVDHLHRAVLIGPLWSLLNPQEVPVGSASEEGGMDGLSTNLRAIYRAITQTFQRIQEERMNYTDEQLKLLIEARNEKEKNLFIKKQDTMTSQQQKVFKLNQSLGIGEWAVGGTKAIYSYDPERYEVERQERALAGIVDYPQSAAEGRTFDMMGFDYGADYEADGGYDNAQTAEDDY